jgi:hypothetical protein
VVKEHDHNQYQLSSEIETELNRLKTPSKAQEVCDALAKGLSYTQNFVVRLRKFVVQQQKFVVS